LNYELSSLHEIFKKAVNVELKEEMIGVTFCDKEEFEQWIKDRVEKELKMNKAVNS
jgi:hypothetical protein